MYIHDGRHKTPYLVFLSCVLLITSVTWNRGDGRKWFILVSFRITRVPEASGSIPEALPEVLHTVLLFRCSSGSFRKLSGRVAGRLQGVIFYVGSGSFRKDSGSVAGRETGMSYLNQINVSDVTSVVIGRSRNMLSFQSTVSRFPGRLPEGFRKLSGRLQAFSILLLIWGTPMSNESIL